MCTVVTGRTSNVEILHKKGDEWFRQNKTKKLSDHEHVIAITWVPEPADHPAQTEAKHAGRTRALIGEN
jgi:hypothetical protein